MSNAFDSTNFPTTEPEEIVVGDRWCWTRPDLAVDYPSSAYGVTYVADLQGSGSTSFTLTASGTDHTIEVASATTAGYTAGTYAWQLYVTRTSDSQRKSLAVGAWALLKNLSASTADPRSHVKKVLDAIE